MLLGPFESTVVEPFDVFSDNLIVNVWVLFLLLLVPFYVAVVEIGTNEGSDVGIVFFELSTIYLSQVP